MPATSLPRIPLNADQQQQIIAFNQLVEELDYLLGGFLDSKNAREFGGWLIAKDNLASKDGDVGMSTKDTAADDIRFWAGDALTGVPKFKVTKSGLLSAIGALISSASGYPKFEMDPTNNVFRAYTDATHYVEIAPVYNNAPTIKMISPQTTFDMFVNPDTTGNSTISNSGGRVDINSANNVRFNTAPSGTLQIPDSSNNMQSGVSGTITYVKNVSGGVPTFGTITVTKGLITAFT